MKTKPTCNSRRFGLRLASHARALLAFSALAALAMPAWSLAQAPTFDPLIATHKGGGDYWNRVGVAAVGDFDGDGRQDAFVTDGSPNLRLMLGNGNGAFAVHYVFTTSTSAPVLVRAADLNGDGRLDVVCASGQGDLKPLVLLNTGNNGSGVPQFTVTPYAAFGSGIRSLTVGDLDGVDGPDFIVGNAYASLQVYLNNGDGTFTAGQSTAITGAGGPSVGTGAIVDLNSDSKADFVVASSQSVSTNVFFGNGDGTLQAPVEIASSSFKVIAADLNHDGAPDLLEVNGSELRVYLNDGGGTFGSPALYSSGGIYPSSVATADFNGDGNLDAVVSNQSSHNVAVLLGDGSGGVGAPTLFTVNQVPVDLSVADFNGDGKVDVATLGYNQDTMGVLLNTTVAALPTQTLTILGGLGNVGDAAPNVEYYNSATGNWQPAYLADKRPQRPGVEHDWGVVSGTNHWVNYKASGSLISDPGAGPTTNQTLWYLYRVRFTVPADAQNPTMTFSVKADNFVQVAINGVATGGSLQLINNTWVPNVIVGQADQLNADAVFSQAIQPGENTITLNVGDWGGLNGFNFRIDLTVDSNDPLEIIPVETDSTPPIIMAPADITEEATSAAGAVVTFAATAEDDVDGPVAVVASPSSGSTFALGTTAVGLAASDASGNDATASFMVTVEDTTAPALTVPGNQTLEATGPGGATATFSATATDAVGVTSLTSSAASGSTFPIGTTAVTVAAADAAGNSSAGLFTVTVADTTAPVVGSVTPSSNTLWPPNKKMVPMTIDVAAMDIVGVTYASIVSVSTSEPDGSVQWEITGPLTLKLRSDRLGTGSGRIYTITVEVCDAAGNVSTRTTTVSVPHDQGSDKGAKSGKNK